jgi:hypothetical protein
MVGQGIANWAQNGNAAADMLNDPYSNLYNTINKNYLQYVTSPAAQVLTPAAAAMNVSPNQAALEDIRENKGVAGAPGIGAVQSAVSGGLQGLTQGLQGAFAGMAGPGVGGAGGLDYAKFMQSAKAQKMGKEKDVADLTDKVRKDQIVDTSVRAVSAYNDFSDLYSQAVKDINTKNEKFDIPAQQALADKLLQIIKPGQRLFNPDGTMIANAGDMVAGLPGVGATLKGILNKVSSNTDIKDATELNSMADTAKILRDRAIKTANARIDEFANQDTGEILRPNYEAMKIKPPTDELEKAQIKEEESRVAQQKQADRKAKTNITTGYVGNTPKVGTLAKNARGEDLIYTENGWAKK